MGKESGLGEVAPNIRYGETPEQVLIDFESFMAVWDKTPDAKNWNSFLQNLPICQALKTGLDMAFTRCTGAAQNMDIAAMLGLGVVKPRPIAYTIPIMAPDTIATFIEKENLRRFQWLKVKVNKETAIDMIDAVLRATSMPVAIDGNEAWTDPGEVLHFEKQINSRRIMFLEQPLPAHMKTEYIWLKTTSLLEIWGDESILSEPDPQYWKAAFSGINVKLMKAGSLQNAVHMLQAAKAMGLKTMIGCMVETSIGISAALGLESLADYVDLDGFLLLTEEPFGWVKEENGVIMPGGNQVVTPGWK